MEGVEPNPGLLPINIQMLFQYIFDMLLRVGTMLCQFYERSSHISPYKIFDDVEERGC
jgi:hypothetical protein